MEVDVRVDEARDDVVSRDGYHLGFGSHGFGALYDLLVGSSSRGILKSSTVPVLVVPVRES